MSKIFTPVLHLRIEERKKQRPMKVGQNVLAAAGDKRAEATYEDADAVRHTALQIQDHLVAQDAEIEKILATMVPLKAT